MGKRDDKAKPQPSSREAKLAQALRANLRRRKTGGEAKADAGAKSGAKTTD